MSSRRTEIMRRTRVTIYVTILFASCLLAGAIPQSKLKDKISIETLAARALETYLKVSYKGNGKSISASALSLWLTKNKVSVSKLPSDIGAAINKGTVEGLLIPDVSNPRDPGTRGEVVLVRSQCLLSTAGCSHRGFLIQPPSFLECDDCCEHCSGCEGSEPPLCDIYRTCVCTHGRCPDAPCKSCSGC
jgi:hypothetical protein